MVFCQFRYCYIISDMLCHYLIKKVLKNYVCFLLLALQMLKFDD